MNNMSSIEMSKAQLNLLTVVNVEVCQARPGEERAPLHMHKAVFTLLLLDDLLYPGRPLVHQVPAPDAAVQTRVDLVENQIQHEHLSMFLW